MKVKTKIALDEQIDDLFEGYLTFDNITLLFQYACRTGNLAAAKRLNECCTLCDYSVLSNKNAAFRLACKYGHFDVAKWIASTWNVSYDIDIKIFKSVIAKDNVEFASWLVDYAKFITIDKIKANNISILYSACKRGNSKTIRWLVEYFRLTCDDLLTSKSLHRLYDCSHFKTAKWLIEHFNITWSEHHKENTFALNAACQSGDSEFIQWYILRYPTLKYYVDRDKILSVFTRRFTYTEWAIEYFGFTGDYVKSKMDTGDADVFKFVIDKYGFTPDEIQKFGIKYCERSMIMNYFHIVQLLTKHFLDVDPLCFNDVHFSHYCDVKILQWLVDYVGIKPDKVDIKVRELLTFNEPLGPKSALKLT